MLTAPMQLSTGWWQTLVRPVCETVHTGSIAGGDRKSTRLNSSHTVISYAVFCLKKKKEKSADDCNDSKGTDGTNMSKDGCRIASASNYINKDHSEIDVMTPKTSTSVTLRIDYAS